MTEISYGSAANMSYDFDRQEVRVCATIGRAPVICRISRAYIEGRFGDQATDIECLDAAMLHFDRLTDEVGYLLATRQFQADGSVLLGGR